MLKSAKLMTKGVRIKTTVGRVIFNQPSAFTCSVHQWNIEEERHVRSSFIIVS